MAKALPKLLTFEDFLEWYPDDGRRYELIEGEIVEMRPGGQHEFIASFIDAETLGIPEYWIVDYLGLGATRYIGKLKQPAISVYQLMEGEYQIRQFRGAEQVISATFPDLTLTAAQVFQA